VATLGDITWHGKKFVGSAQKRFGTSLLQHGSILLRSQENILSEIFDVEERAGVQALLGKVTCLDNILGRRVEIAAVSAALISGFKTALNVELQPGRLSSEEEAIAASLIDKYREPCKQQ
jgi:lipoate-protein ligase A